MYYSAEGLVSVEEIYSTLGDDKSLRLFRIVATKGGTTEELTVRLRLSHKEYYSRMAKFLRIGLVKRKNARYFLTAFGKVVFDSQEIVRRAVEDLWKLKALDSIDFSDEITTNERRKLLESLLDDLDIRQILSNSFLQTQKEQSA